MMRRTIAAISMFVFLLSGVVQAFPEGETGLREELAQLRSRMEEMAVRYEARIAELEARLAQVERDNGAAMRDKDGQASHGHGPDDREGPPGEHHHHGLITDRISVIGALDARFASIEGEKNTFLLHEAKIGAQGNITDRLFAYLTMTKHHGHDAEIEEAYAVLDWKEAGLSFKPGKFFVDLGPENRAHFFNRRTITLSAMHEGMLGNGNWDDTGLQVDWRVPHGRYSEISLFVLDGDNPVLFGDGTDAFSNSDLPVGMNWTGVYDMTPGILSLGGSFTSGKWDAAGEHPVILAAGDIGWSAGSVGFAGEFMYRYREDPLSMTGGEDSYGYYALGSWSFPIGKRYLYDVELLFRIGEFVPGEGAREMRYTPQFTLNINRWAKLRASYEARRCSSGNENRLITQFALAF